MEEMPTKIEHLLHELTVLPLSGGHGAEAAGFSLTNYTFWLIVAVVLLLTFFIVASRKVKLVPSGIGNLAEAGVDFVRNGVCVDVMGPEGKKYFPFLGTIFFFVLFNNLLGNIPPALPGTGTVGTTFTWAIIVFLVYNGIGIKKIGFFGYIKSLIPSGTPWWLSWLIFLIELISHFLRPFTLGIRLFANMYAGHIMLGVFTIFAAIFIEQFSAISIAVVPLSFLMQVILRVFELMVAVLQAYIFTILTAVYIDGALHAGSH
ncbi:MAG: F0F1 ATP synthase subunit A [Coriobacteriia bacterium]|nr:F0F1 ATP synthase subunit A [Coriobacteriia bacterium]MBN2840111.1 F0F1 ATP synthase subunit A [Coriobacteriia bacterium]